MANPRCTVPLMAKAYTPPFAASERFLGFPRGELWLLSQLVWLSELRSAPTHGCTHWSSTRCTLIELVTIDGFHADRFDHDAVRATAPGPAAVLFACGTPAPATTVSAHLVVLPLLPPSSPR